MQAIIFCGLQATGKTTFYRNHFLKTHIRISLDMLNTRNKESQFIELCLRTQQKFVVDNTNLTKVERAKYIEAAKARKFRVVGYYFESKVEDAIRRNSTRTGKENIPEIGIRGAYKRLERPGYEEGFDELYYVRIGEEGFVVREWQPSS
ncbi:AAA family ATPase [Telluribacter sp. SYSU D00476]|uniref:AAA family ATPase n=1 Tax=Telluribacter sp. SYSU D00476 TaxID=2811430 RepID=UPI001FF3DD0F|nr:AAA family ATPase [Telluribacter sp. SYSU D00476]